MPGGPGQVARAAQRAGLQRGAAAAAGAPGNYMPAPKTSVNALPNAGRSPGCRRAAQSRATRLSRRPLESGMLGGVDSEPGHRPQRRREIDERLAAVRARLEELRERRRGADRTKAAANERLEAAQRHAAEAHAA